MFAGFLALLQPLLPERVGVDDVGPAAAADVGGTRLGVAVGGKKRGHTKGGLGRGRPQVLRRVGPRVAAAPASPAAAAGLAQDQA